MTVTLPLLAKEEPANLKVCAPLNVPLTTNEPDVVKVTSLVNDTFTETAIFIVVAVNEPLPETVVDNSKNKVPTLIDPEFVRELPLNLKEAPEAPEIVPLLVTLPLHCIKYAPVFTFNVAPASTVTEPLKIAVKTVPSS